MHVYRFSKIIILLWICFSYLVEGWVVMTKATCRTGSFNHLLPSEISLLNLASGDTEDSCGDGWGDTDVVSKNITAELRNLQQQRKDLVRNSNEGQAERDLFIPIFSIISLTGLVGAYGYEMLRLYLRGELYLPWNNR